MDELNYFDAVRIISLPQRHDRRSEMRRELQRVGLDIGTGKASFFDAIRPDEAAPFEHIGVKGCFHSHLNVLKEARQLGLKNVLVFEDDLIFSSEVGVQLPILLQSLRSQDWDLCYFGHGEQLNQTTTPIWVEWEKRLVCAHFYAVNGHLLTPLIEFLEVVLSREPGDPLGGPMHYDGALSTFREQNVSVRTIIANPSQGGQRPSRSDITPSAKDRIPYVGQLVNLARRARNFLR